MHVFSVRPLASFWLECQAFFGRSKHQGATTRNISFIKNVAWIHTESFIEIFLSSSVHRVSNSPPFLFSGVWGMWGIHFFVPQGFGDQNSFLWGSSILKDLICRFSLVSLKQTKKWLSGYNVHIRYQFEFEPDFWKVGFQTWDSLHTSISVLNLFLGSCWLLDLFSNLQLGLSNSVFWGFKTQVQIWYWKPENGGAEFLVYSSPCSLRLCS